MGVCIFVYVSGVPHSFVVVLSLFCFTVHAYSVSYGRTAVDYGGNCCRLLPVPDTTPPET